MGNSVSIYLKSNFNADAKKYIDNIKYVMIEKESLNKLGNPKYTAYNEPQPSYIENKHLYRLRSEIIVLDGLNILIDRVKTRVFPYQFPGGGVDKGEDIVIAASRECEEEALIIPKNVEFMNIAWYMKFPDPIIFNYGAISLVCIGQKDKEYKGYVKIKDRDEFVDNAEWVPYKDVDLGEPHIVAIERYLEKHPIYAPIITKDMSFKKHLM